MLKFLLIRPGVTDFDEQGRIKGTLNLPLNDHGVAQVVQTIDELVGEKIEAIYTSPCQCCEQTADLLAKSRDMKAKTLKGSRTWITASGTASVSRKSDNSSPESIANGKSIRKRFARPRANRSRMSSSASKQRLRN